MRSVLFLILQIPLFSGCVREPVSPFANALRAASIHNSAVVIDDDSTRLRVEKRAGASLVVETNLLRQHILALYLPTVAPYPGTLTKKVKCDSRFSYAEIFEKGKRMEFRGFKVFANNRYVMGLCIESEIEFAAYRGLIQCPGGELFEVQFFEPISRAPGRFAETLQVLNCPSV